MDYDDLSRIIDAFCPDCPDLWIDFQW